MLWAIILALLPLCFLSAEVQIEKIEEFVSAELPQWKALLELGDAESLEKAKVLILSLKEEERMDGLIEMMKLGLTTVVGDVLARVNKASGMQKMKIAHYARVAKDSKYASVLLDWAEKSKDAMVRELAIRSLGDCGGVEAIARLEALLKVGGLEPFVETAVKASLEKLKKVAP
jgi:hypothetical protein